MARNDTPPRTDSAKTLDLKGRRSGYLALATKPLHILVFLVPLIAFYEYGAWAHLASDMGQRNTILAQRLLEDLFNAMGATSVHLPAILTVVVLLLWHVMSRDRWRVRPGVVLGMWAEAAVWTAPLLVLGVILARSLGVGIEPAANAGFEAATLWERLTIAIGAGLYEELLFRLLGFTVCMLVVEDLLRLGKRAGLVCALVVTSLAFALYHDPQLASGAFDWRLASYYAIAGAYFGIVYAARGFGIVVGVHALYDLVVLVDPLG
ncbi:MAG: CPBP family intramembrane glutamic endopeptidase [Planctomycetota bacterium]